MRDSSTVRIGLSLWGELAFWPQALAEVAEALEAGLPADAGDLRDLAAAYCDGLQGVAALVEETQPCAQTHWGAAVGSSIAGRLSALAVDLAGLAQYVGGEQLAGRLPTRWPDGFYAALLAEAQICLEHLERLAAGMDPVPAAELLSLHQRWLPVLSWLGETLLTCQSELAPQADWERLAAGQALLAHHSRAAGELGAVLSLAPVWVPRLDALSHDGRGAVEDWLQPLQAFLASDRHAAAGNAMGTRLADHIVRVALYYLRRVRQQMIHLKTEARP